MYDVIIIGGGPAGFSAAIYSCRYLLKTLLISEQYGGQIMESAELENYPGFEMISGYEIMKKMQDQATKFGLETQNERATKIERKGDTFLVNDKYEAKSLIIAQGLKRRKLNAKGEQEFVSKGVSYCATCDGAFFQKKIVGVVGGSDSAAHAALLLANYAEKVNVIYRKDKLRAEPYLVKKIEENPKINVIFNTNVVEIKGENVLKSVIFDNGEELVLDGIFIEIGYEPDTELLNAADIEIDNGLIKVNGEQSTSVDGIFAAGDCTTSSNKFNQVITAAGEGAVAANSVYDYIKNSE